MAEAVSIPYADMVTGYADPYTHLSGANREQAVVKEKFKLAKKEFDAYGNPPKDDKIAKIYTRLRSQTEQHMMQLQATALQVKDSINDYNEITKNIEKAYGSVEDRRKDVEAFIKKYVDGLAGLMADKKDDFTKAAEDYLKSPEMQKIYDAIKGLGPKDAKKFSRYVFELVISLDRKVAMPSLGLNPDDEKHQVAYQEYKSAALGKYVPPRQHAAQEG